MLELGMTVINNSGDNVSSFWKKWFELKYSGSEDINRF